MKPMEWIPFVVVGAFATFATRGLPMSRLVPAQLVQKLKPAQELLPLMLLTLLVVYCFSGVQMAIAFESVELIGVSVLTAGIHWWKGNALISLVVGCGTHLILVNAF